eukprot:gnl/MRDRNA2_/MRDRNA2_157966_c0_seq1.p1 gnl/MRDRNA2_/MRDRNA2_157966_c0~~gnl/MRDRNA2_/MRDRNA2_157966_c0_seq1.p1  ORF type:complete len:213 (-),score=42.09 gnl/MRDRNA2_/MRDRNA2_157966_c0_seq1:285-923(-)
MQGGAYQSMLEKLRGKDRDIDSIEAYSKFVVGYLLEQEGPNPGWRKADIEGPVYLVRRRTLPRFQLMVNPQSGVEDSIDSLHKDWELDCQKNYVFYKVEDASKKVRGLWFHDDTERQKIEASLEKALEEIRNNPAGEPQTEPRADNSGGRNDTAGAALVPPSTHMGNNARTGGMDEMPGIVVPRERLRKALLETITSDEFLDRLMGKLQPTG